ncbi:MAG: CBS domain-containing protein, partial [Desulfobacteraceae bacterium]
MVTPGASLKEVVRAMVKGYRRRVVYVVDENRKLLGAI